MNEPSGTFKREGRFEARPGRLATAIRFAMPGAGALRKSGRMNPIGLLMCLTAPAT